VQHPDISTGRHKKTAIRYFCAGPLPRPEPFCAGSPNHRSGPGPGALIVLSGSGRLSPIFCGGHTENGVGARKIFNDCGLDSFSNRAFGCFSTADPRKTLKILRAAPRYFDRPPQKNSDPAFLRRATVPS
jgi:hypothetical protein